MVTLCFNPGWCNLQAFLKEETEKKEKLVIPLEHFIWNMMLPRYHQEILPAEDLQK